MTLYGAEAVAISTTLMESAYQLKILENIYSSTGGNNTDLKENDDGGQRSVHDLINRHQEYQLYFEKIIKLNTISVIDEPENSPNPAEKQQVTKHILESSKDLIEKRLKEQYIYRISQTCAALHDILKATSLEMASKGTFRSLELAVENRRIAHENVENAHKNEEELRKSIKVLRKRIESTVKSHEQAVKERKELIAHLKDQLQELKAKTLMEKKYKENICRIQLTKVKAECDEREQQLMTEIKACSTKMEEEKRATFEITSWLQNRMTELNAIENLWNQRSNTDISQMQHKLDVLKKSREKDLQTLAELTEKYEKYKTVVVEERIKAEEERRQQEKLQMNLESARIIQNWFRTVMVRKQIGPYGKKKRKGKKGKKKKK